MPNAARWSCQVPGCDFGPPNGDSNDPYITHEENTTKAELKEDLE